MSKPSDTAPMGVLLTTTASTTVEDSPSMEAPPAPLSSPAKAEVGPPEADEETEFPLKKERLTRGDLDELFGTKPLVPKPRRVAPASEAVEYAAPRTLRAKNPTPLAEPLIVVEPQSAEADAPLRARRPAATTVSTRPLTPSRKAAIVVTSVAVMGSVAIAFVEAAWPSHASKAAPVVAAPQAVEAPRDVATGTAPAVVAAAASAPPPARPDAPQPPVPPAPKAASPESATSRTAIPTRRSPIPAMTDAAARLPSRDTGPSFRDDPL